MTDQTLTPEQARASLIATFDGSIAALTAALADAKPTDYVLAWPNGLGLAFKDEGREAYVCGVIHAEVVATQDMPEDAWAFIPTYTNGAGERAQCVTRPTALQWALDEAHKGKAWMLEFLAQHS